MAMAFAFAIFGKKRRDEEPPAPDEVLQANAARGHGDAFRAARSSTASFAPRPCPAPLDARGRHAPLAPAVADRGAQGRSGPVGRVDPPDELRERRRRRAIDGHERRMIRYRVVRLLDAPDELRSAEIGQLDQGDEVQLIERPVRTGWSSAPTGARAGSTR